MDDLGLDALVQKATNDLDRIMSRKVIKTSAIQKLRLAAESSFEPDPETQVEDLDYSMLDLLEAMHKHNASDLHIKESSPPMFRVNGALLAVGEHILSARESRELIFSICTSAQQTLLEMGKEVDFAYSYKGARFRVNAYLQKATYSTSIRLIKEDIPDFHELLLPGKSIMKLVDYKHGLVLVTGPAGSGKSTTLAAIIDHINEKKPLHIITIEDPVEYIHAHKKSIITQREIGTDTVSFQHALKYCLRQDPNVILIGEMRDPETILIAAQAAETGHLVLSTLHTPNAVQAISRVLDVFSIETQRQMQLLLASNLRGVLSQRLLARKDGEGRVPAVEIMLTTPTISSLILENNVNDIYKYIQEGSSEGMQTMNQSLYELYKGGYISYDDALANSDHVTELRMTLEGFISSADVLKKDNEDNLMSWI